MPAQNKYRRVLKQKRRPKTLSKKGDKKLLLIAISLTAIIFLIKFLFTSNFWDGTNKLPLSIVKKDGSVVVATLDPKLKEITKINIPSNTQVEVAKNLGVWKIKSVWELGKKEGVDGELLNHTLIRNFHFPISAYAEEEALGLTGGNYGDVFKAIFSTYTTNLSLADRVAMATFALNVENTKLKEINLEDTTYLEKSVLVGGEEGYVVTGNASSSVLSTFSDDRISGGRYTVLINYSGKQPIEDTIATIEVLGGKVASVKSIDPKEIKCEIRGENASVLKKLKKLFGCEKVHVSEGSGFDLEMTIGEKFFETF